MNYKINLKNYSLPTKKAGDTAEPYKVKQTISNVMLSPNQGHKGFRFYTISKLAKRIINCEPDFIILNATDYEMVKGLFDATPGFGPGDAECVSRIYEPEEIEAPASVK